MSNGLDNARREFVRATLMAGAGFICAGAGLAAFLPRVTRASNLPQPLAAVEAIGKGELTALAENHRPVRARLLLSRRDAWRPSLREQSVILYREKPGDAADCFVALSPICPHKGCMVEMRPVDGKPAFFCPCHEARFNVKGDKEVGPSPRNLDRLPLTVAQHDGKPWLFVQWQEFQTGTAESRPRA